MARILLQQKISNLKVQGFENVERTIRVHKIDLDGDAERAFLGYTIAYELDGKDVTKLFQQKSSYDWYIYNTEYILVRDENMQPILDEDSGEYLKAPAFSLVMDTFDSLRAIPYQVLEFYILENDTDGKWDIEIDE